MAITSSAKKAIRVSERKRVFNVRRRSTLRDTSKQFSKLVAAKDASGAAKLLPAAYQAIDKALKNGVLKANTAARKKASLAAALKKVQG